ncbi:MAG: isoleucine--tRNA ligase [Candidatus Thermoplasmatota archaeon]|nr:isoleucine--tRNA ligase [Euryarchaeota archaeon]MBU4032409.1 isoleucine--tRNA ligase [Candidatus Thermoplasmatota archaeon]MBU4070864.1 isoleucine--tRNA ligase [Candidatus Thermoplasmatota archaeon]MBU4145083.1 isoleucine--tRNA ligase [Candidatus Thermoplasmatota archaeon]MBU4592064.1 isoleucine--tRNA ligase [Candidatus Thermoplasmatota archaeon]
MGNDNEKKFADASSWVSFPKMEAEMLEFWNRNDIFGKLRAGNAGKTPFVFLEGPPTANGMPHVGHALGRAIKDVYLRHMAMSGFDVIPWKGGWDCHGLPVEIEVEKELGLRSKKDIIEYGIDKFNLRCRDSVMRYEDIWKKMSQRLGFWIDMDDPYITMKTPYIESVWWSLKTIYEKGLLEKGHYIVPYCPRCGTPLSSHEVAQGYKDVKELSLTLKFKLAEYDDAKLGPNAFILAWTTTPWTLPGNVALAVGKDINYAIVEQNGERLILASDLLETIIEGEYEMLGMLKGSEMVGWKYQPLFDFMDLREEGKKAYEVVAADFVTTAEGTGVVHTAVMYGEDDYNLGMKIGLPARHTVDTEGKFNELVSLWQGKFVKKKGLDVEIAVHLHDNNRLYKKANYVHSYPFCWRCDSPLLYYGLDSWFVRMSRLRTEMMANNETITWKPEHLKYGRFGNFLEELKDWALSRNRFWGTPLPVWNCACGHQLCVGSFEELGKLAGGLPENFEPHRPWVDEIDVKCPKCQARMERETYVIDTWYDSGSAFFAQFHYPFENEEMFKRAFPADFITEALDQTRGWFYTMLAVGTSVFNEAPYKKCLTQGLMLNEDGAKMSKSKGTALDPFKIYDEWGADALRLALYTTPCWASSKFSDATLKEAKSKVMTTLWNVYVFFVNNANLDGFDPADAVKSEALLDRWIVSRQNSLAGEIGRAMEDLEVHRAVKAIFEFVDELSNWYLRRSRRRFWSGEDPAEKLAAYSTLYKVLCQTSKLLAPFTPYMADALYQNLAVGHLPDAKESVHLDSFPTYDESMTDRALEDEMKLIIDIAEAGRNARQTSGVRLRQPLSEAFAVTEREFQNREEAIQILEDELNVKEMFIGPEPPVRELASAEGKGFKVYIETHITKELKLEGISRDVVRRIQSLRKEMDLKYDQTVKMGVDGDDEILEAMKLFRDYITGETLAVEVVQGELEGGKPGEWKILDMTLKVWLLEL